MPRAYPHSHLCHGTLVGFSVKHRANEPTYFAYFRSPDGRRLERDTNQTGAIRAAGAARLIIEKEYAPAPTHADELGWDETVERVKARLVTAGNRPSTTRYYLKLIRLVRKVYKTTNGPADITPGMAAKWRDRIMTTPGRRKKLPSAHYVAGLVCGLNALWSKWLLDDLKIVTGNPWAECTPPKTDKLPVKFASDTQVEQFYAWVDERFGGWSFARLFLETKAYTGCRLMDLCSLKSAQLRGGRIVFPADLTKGRKERAVPLPAELYASLEAFSGETWLWESYPQGLKTVLAAKGFPTHQLKLEFSPQRLYFWVETLFADYRTAHPDRPLLTSHMFRKRAFTKAWHAGIDPRRAAIAIGCNVDTMMQHYVGLDEQEVTDDVFARLNGQTPDSLASTT